MHSVRILLEVLEAGPRRLGSGFIFGWELSDRGEDGFDVSAVEQLLIEPDPLPGLGSV